MPVRLGEPLPSGAAAWTDRGIGIAVVASLFVVAFGCAELSSRLSIEPVSDVKLRGSWFLDNRTFPEPLNWPKNPPTYRPARALMSHRDPAASAPTRTDQTGGVPALAGVSMLSPALSSPAFAVRQPR